MTRFYKYCLWVFALCVAGASALWGEDAADRYGDALRERSAAWKNVSEEQRAEAVERLTAIYRIVRDDGNGDFRLRNGFWTDFKTALDEYDTFIEDFAATPFAAEALYQKSVIYTQAHMFDDGFDAVRHLVTVWPGSDRVGDALIQAFMICEALRQGARQRRFGGRVPWLIDREAILKLYEELYKLAPQAPIAPRVLFQKGCLSHEISDGFFKGELKQDAIDAFEMMIASHPDSSLVPEAYLNLAATYRELCQGDVWDQLAATRAMNYYTDFYNLFPEHEAAEFAFNASEDLRRLIADNRVATGDFYYVRRNNARAAVIFYNEAISTAPDSESAALARSRIEDIRAGKRASMTLIDWIFGRYPAPVTKDFLDAPSQKSLEHMGFQRADSLERAQDSSKDDDRPAGGDESPVEESEF
ncbi:MAG: hypothetical protein K6B46_06890 [Opitutales bacterium]|nr:hypothetical protein [Opitutales bacterium]